MIDLGNDAFIAQAYRDYDRRYSSYDLCHYCEVRDGEVHIHTHEKAKFIGWTCLECVAGIFEEELGELSEALRMISISAPKQQIAA